MKYFDRNRIMAAIVVSIAAHIGIFALLAVLNLEIFAIQEQEFGPVYVELSELPAVTDTSEPTPEETPDGSQDTPEPADTPEEVDTPEPADTPEEIDTPEPIDTEDPDTLIPENTPTPPPVETQVKTPTPRPTPKPTRQVRPTPRPTRTPKPEPSNTPRPPAPTKTATPKATNTPKPTPTSMFEAWDALENLLKSTPVPTTANTPDTNGGTGSNNSENTETTTTTDGGIVIEWASPTEGRKPIKEVEPVIPSDVAVGIPMLKVTISFKLLSSGILTELKVKTSSGYSEIDTAVLEALRKWQFEPIGSDITVIGEIPYVIEQK